jgi:hypothetical protein
LEVKLQNRFNVKFWTVLAIILVAAAVRIIPHPPNFSPIAAMALFGGCYLSNRFLAIAVPLAAMFLSDIVIGFHVTMPAVYLAIGIVAVLGMWLQKRNTASTIALSAVASSVIFFVITNFAVFAQSGLYPQNAHGLVACFVAAVPFFQNSMVGDLFYTGVFFGSWVLLERRVTQLRPV